MATSQGRDRLDDPSQLLGGEGALVGCRRVLLAEHRALLRVVPQELYVVAAGAPRRRRVRDRADAAEAEAAELLDDRVAQRDELDGGCSWPDGCWDVEAELRGWRKRPGCRSWHTHGRSLASTRRSRRRDAHARSGAPCTARGPVRVGGAAFCVGVGHAALALGKRIRRRLRLRPSLILIKLTHP